MGYVELDSAIYTRENLVDTSQTATQLAASLREAAFHAWQIPNPSEKCAVVFSLQASVAALASDAALASHRDEKLQALPCDTQNLDPGRPQQPVLVAASDVPKRQTGRAGGRGALLHAIAHIEFNAINLALDAVWRYPNMPVSYVHDWVSVAIDETRHFTAISEELRTEGIQYGDFSAHDGLWDMARRTAPDLLARMALIPRVLEARGLDATPVIQRKLNAVGDARGVALLQQLLDEEIRHVHIGDHWFKRLCTDRNRDPEATYRALLQAFEAPWPKPPINQEARRQAGFSDAELAWLAARAP